MICAWCGTKMREGTSPTSHGMCFGCRVETLVNHPKELAVLLRAEHLERHDCPTWGMWIDLGNGG